MQIEPTYSKKFYKNCFISNKSRYFFDGLQYINYNNIFYNSIKDLFRNLFKLLYIFELNFLKNKSINFFYIIYENVNIDLLCLLSLFKQRYLFIKLKYIFSRKLNNNTESNFLFHKIKFENIDFCLLININLNLENTSLNLKLKQRILKGNFKLLFISSYFHLLSNFNIIGNGTKIVKLICEGINPLCQIIKYKKSPYIIINSKLLVSDSNKFIYSILLYWQKFINYLQISILNTVIYEPNINLINNFITNNNKILFNFSSICMLNVLNLEYNFVTSILNINSLYLTKQINILIVKKVYLVQNYFYNNNKYYYFYLPIKTFFEDSGIFFNTEGLIKKSFKFFNNLKVKSNWKILRFIFNQLNKKVNVFTKNLAFMINFNLKIKFNFLKLLYLLYLAKKIINNNFLVNNIHSFIIKQFNNNIIFYKKSKFISLRFKFWLNDYFVGGRDGFSSNSLIMIKCSKITRLELTNFYF